MTGWKDSCGGLQWWSHKEKVPKKRRRRNPEFIEQLKEHIYNEMQNISSTTCRAVFDDIKIKRATLPRYSKDKTLIYVL